jgi:hypothetical protein
LHLQLLLVFFLLFLIMVFLLLRFHSLPILRFLSLISRYAFPLVGIVHVLSLDYWQLSRLPMLNGSLDTITCHILRLWMEEKSSRHRG